MKTRARHSPYMRPPEDSPVKNLRSRTGSGYKSNSTQMIDYDLLPPTPATPNPLKKSFIASDEELDFMGGKVMLSSSAIGRNTPQHFLLDDSSSPTKLSTLLDSPDKLKGVGGGALLQETLSFDSLPLDENYFDGVMDQLQNLGDASSSTGDVNTPQHSPISSPYSMETNYPYTPLTEPPPTPLSPTKKGGGGKKQKGSGEKRGKRKRSTMMESNNDDLPPWREKRRRKSPNEVRLELPLSPDNEWPYMRDGVIVKLELRNFMCHRNRVWKFGPHLNIVTGENGSGKTAIQTAIMLGFGVKATTTGRADSMQMMIKRGESSATIELSFSNYNGTHSKRKFGDVITIRKGFTKSSSSTKLIQRDGRLVPLKKRDLDSLLRPLQIHLDNPVQILTQKVSTSFLKTQEPGTLYKSFLDITGIGPQEETLQASKLNVQRSREILTHKQRLDLEEVIKKAKEYASQYENILNMEKYKVLCADLLREYGWALVTQVESSISELQSQLAGIQEKIGKIEGDKSKVLENKEKIVNSNESEKAILSDLRKQLKLLEGKDEKAHLIVRQRSTANQKISGKIQRLSEGKFKLQLELQDLERQMRDSLSVQANDDERLKLQTQQEITSYQYTIDQATVELNLLRADKARAEEHLAMCKAVEAEVCMQLGPLKTQFGEKVRGLKSIRDAESTKYDRFGSKMKYLVARVEAARWAGEPPIGPLGAWFTIKKEHQEYTAVVEVTLGSTIRSFATHNDEDVAPLRELINEVFGRASADKPGIISVKSKKGTAPREGEWWSRGKAEINGYPTLLDIFDIQHPKVTEALIDNNNVEKVILFKTEQEACQICKDCRKVPKNCIYGLSKDCYRIYPVPNYSARNFPLRKKATLLQTTRFENPREALQSEIKRLEAEIAELSLKLSEAQKVTKGVSRQIVELEARMQQKSAEVNRAKSLQRTCETTLADLNKVVDAVSQNDFMEDRKRLLESTICQREGELAAELNVKNECDMKLRESEAESKAIKSQMDELRKRIQRCDDEEGNLKTECDKLDKKIKEFEAMLKTLSAERKDLETKIKNKNKDLKQKIEAASSKGERIQTSRDPEEIKSAFEGKRLFYQENVHKIKAKDGIRRIKESWERKAKEMKKQIDFCLNILKALEPLLNMQTITLSKNKEEFLINFKNYFKFIIQRRGYLGQAVYEDGKLFYYIAKNKESEMKAQANIKTDEVTGKPIINWKGLKEFAMQLSGGERSYSTMAYISAIRQIMPGPFFMLDEFEVFMDNENKRVSMDILVEQAHSLRDAQFFVFTPHDSELKQDSYINIIKLQH